MVKPTCNDLERLNVFRKNEKIDGEKLPYELGRDVLPLPMLLVLGDGSRRGFNGVISDAELPNCSNLLKRPIFRRRRNVHFSSIQSQKSLLFFDFVSCYLLLFLLFHKKKSRFFASSIQIKLSPFVSLSKNLCGNQIIFMRKGISVVIARVLLIKCTSKQSIFNKSIGFIVSID